jgi:hypothetical protein
VSTDAERRSVTRPDGRVIEFLVAGPEDGLPLVLHEGTPCGLVLYPPTVQAAAGPARGDETVRAEVVQDRRGILRHVHHAPAGPGRRPLVAPGRRGG